MHLARTASKPEFDYESRLPRPEGPDNREKTKISSIIWKDKTAVPSVSGLSKEESESYPEQTLPRILRVARDTD